jgi:predicted Zn-dependent protease
LCLTGTISELQNDTDGAAAAYEQVLRYNPYSVPAMLAISHILRNRDQFSNAIEYLKHITKIDERNGEVWGALGML